MADLDRKELDRMATVLTEVKSPDVYAKDEKHINKPISNIKFGHILNVNWDNILNTFRIVQKFFKETVLNQDVSTDNIANKIVKRNADKSIEVGDIYCNSQSSNETVVEGISIPFRKNNLIQFSENADLLMKFLKLDKNGIVEDIRMAGKVVTYAHAPEVEGYVVTRYNRIGDRGGGDITQRTLQKKINNKWYTVSYYTGDE